MPDEAREMTAVDVLVSETTWLEAIVKVDCTNMPDGSRMLTYILANGHRYVIPLRGPVLGLTQRAVSPVILPGPNAAPRNGHGA